MSETGPDGNGPWTTASTTAPDDPVSGGCDPARRGYGTTHGGSVIHPATAALLADQPAGGTSQ